MKGIRILGLAMILAIVLAMGLLALRALVSGSVGSHLRAAPVAAADQTEYLHLRAWIDGSDYVHIRGNEVWYVHRNFQYPGLYKASGCEACPPVMDACIYDPPLTTTINGDDWYPQWLDNCGYDDPNQESLNRYTDLDPPQPLQEIEINLCLANGRGAISITQQPSAANDYTTIVLLDDDAPWYADWYEFKLCYSTLSPTPTPVPVGGTVELRGGTADLSAQQPGTAAPYHIALAGVAAAGAIALAAGAWYARRRFSQRLR